MKKVKLHIYMTIFTSLEVFMDIKQGINAFGNDENTSRNFGNHNTH